MPTSFTDRLAAFYPSLNVNLDEDIADQLDTLFDPSELASFATALSLRHDAENAATAIIQQATLAYVDGVLDRLNQKPEKQDTAALIKVANKSAQLEEALLALTEHPHLEAQLEERIRGFHALASNSDGVSLSDLIGSRHNIFQFMRDMLIDLQTCAEATTNRKPKREDYSEDFVFGDAPTAEQQYNRAEATWKRRSKARNLGADHPLQCFLLTVYPYWVEHSAHPFTEGMYFAEIGETISPVISVLDPILSKIDSEITPQNIATAIRKLREEGKFTSLS
ncbi:hypothetical protein [Celeribacter halophilus]|uniref:Uncharacterized protein n=1 Tax=Celeribacter halophilus TaxID=576117 RepID=A0A1I3R3I8_9RHOB|nr:hypothetical protein [Celeribacter halophilus]PZX05005.1 hypothetical protein LX82_03581 [Celeribacter halophilus]SFJ40928.1 hypothetical protein SAMN04488138_104258 [Celeribacter halophilus]